MPRSAAKAHAPRADTSAVTPLANSRKSARKREEIIRAAIELFNERSYAQATMSDIAASLDLRDAALYYYFDGKQSLAYACHLRSLERFERLLREAQAAEDTGLAKLRRFLQAMLEDAGRNGPELYFGDNSYLSDDQRQHVNSWMARLVAMMERYLEQGMADGSIVACEPKIVVQLIIGMLIWLAKWVPSIEGMTVDRLMTAIGVTALSGLRS